MRKKAAQKRGLLWYFISVYDILNSNNVFERGQGMYYLQIENLHEGMTLAKSVIGEDGNKLVGEGVTLSANILKRMNALGFQGAYIESPEFEDIVIADIIPDSLRAQAFEALYKHDINRAAAIAVKIAEEIKYKNVLKLDLLDIKNKKNYIFKHCVSVAVYAIVIGVGYGLNIEQLDNLAVAGLLHDIGKLDIRKKVLNANHVYSEKEMDEMKKHPLNAYETLKDYPMISSVTRNSILFHHENIDGSGYYGITGEKIGVFPRILRVADTYDALTAQREYRKAVSPADAIEYIMGNAGTLFDKSIVEIFIKRFPIYPVGFTYRLSNQEIAVIVNNEINPMRPIVRTLAGKEINLAEEVAYRSVMIQDMM